MRRHLRRQYGEETEQDELEIVMNKLRKEEGKIQYHTKEDLPTKEEAM